MKEILFIYSENCPDCARMKSFIEMAIVVTGINCKIREVNSETDEAIDIAIEKGIEDLPGCSIGNKVFFGKNGFTYESILEAVKNIGV